MNDGRAVIHINGAEYMLAGRYPDKDSPEVQRLSERITRLVEGKETQIQNFEVLIDGHEGRLMVRPSELVSVAVVFVPASDVKVRDARRIR